MATPATASIAYLCLFAYVNSSGGERGGSPDTFNEFRKLSFLAPFSRRPRVSYRVQLLATKDKGEEKRGGEGESGVALMRK